MRLPQHVYSVMIVLGAMPVARLRTLPLVSAAALPAAAAPPATLQGVQHEGHGDAEHGYSLTKRSVSELTDAWLHVPGGASAASSALVGPVLIQDVAAAEGTTTPAPSPANGEEQTTEEPYDDGGGEEGGDFGGDILNTLLEVVGALMSFFTDPPGAIQKMVEQAGKLTGAARSIMGTVRQQQQKQRQRQEGGGLPGLDSVLAVLEQVPKLADAAVEIAKLGPVGARAARGMLEEAKRILETAKGLVEAGGQVAETARGVAQRLSRPWHG